MRRHNYQDRSLIEFGADTTAGSLSKEESKELREEMKHRRADPSCAVGVRIVTNKHDLSGVVESWGLNHPSFHFDNGQRGFISPADDAEELRLLFKQGYGPGRRDVPRYKYPIEEMKVEIMWYRTPECPQCGHDMTYGMCQWQPNDPNDGFMSGWLCGECIPIGVSEGIK